MCVCFVGLSVCVSVFMLGCAQFHGCPSPASSMGIPDLIDQVLQCYKLFKSIENAPVACLELNNVLGMSVNVLEQIKGHVFVGDESKKITLSTQVEKYQSSEQLCS